MCQLTCGLGPKKQCSFTYGLLFRSFLVYYDFSQGMCSCARKSHDWLGFAVWCHTGISSSGLLLFWCGLHWLPCLWKHDWGSDFVLPGTPNLGCMPCVSHGHHPCVWQLPGELLSAIIGTKLSWYAYCTRDNLMAAGIDSQILLRLRPHPTRGHWLLYRAAVCTDTEWYTVTYCNRPYIILHAIGFIGCYVLSICDFHLACVSRICLQCDP